MRIDSDKSYPLVSVIVPCYNYGKYLSDCLQAIKDQIYPYLEVLIVDDESTDNTKEIADHFLSDSRFRYIYQTNKGLCGARNTGIRNSVGDFICIVDPDDIWFPIKLERQIDYMNNHPRCGLLYSDAEILIDGKPTGATIRNGRLFYDGWSFEKMMMDNGVVCPSVMIRKLCFEKLGLFDEVELKQYSEDWDMWLRISYEFEIGSIREPLLYYRVHDQNMSKVKYRQHWKNMLITLKRHLPKVKDTKRRKICYEHNIRKIIISSLRTKDIKMFVCLLFCLVSGKLFNKLVWPKVRV